MKMKEIKVSVIVPVYNVEPYLPRCLDSLIGQTLQDIEIICIDDCSTDKSLEILHDYMKKRPAGKGNRTEPKQWGCNRTKCRNRRRTGQIHGICGFR